MRQFVAVTFLATLFASNPAGAFQISETFTDPTHFTSQTTAVWNGALGVYQPPLEVSDDLTPPDIIPFQIGTGADGEFRPSTYNNFGTVASGTITLPTTRTYQFTNFTLAPGMTLVTSGSAPLEIHVQGNFWLQGNAMINLSGTDGGATGAPGVSGPGGGNGGPGGTGSQPAAGTPVDPAQKGGGAAGQNVGPSTGGGGAGHNNEFGGTPAGASSGLVGIAGSSYDNTIDSHLNQFPILALGGSGGGGGGKLGVSPGGGGGGGGGVLKLFVAGNFTVDSAASIYANGGNGGGFGGTSAGSGGGGGSGGSMWLFVWGQVQDIASPSPPTGIMAIGGQGGTSSGAGDTGGNGAEGLIWALVPGGWYLNPLNVDTAPNTYAGSFVISSNSYIFDSNFYDTQETSPTYGPVTTNDSGGNIGYQVAGANNPSATPSPSDFVDISQIQKLNGFRYIKLRITLTATAGQSYPQVMSVKINGGGALFNYQLSGCARVHPGPGTWGGLQAIAFGLLFFAYLFALPFLSRRQRDR